MTNAVGIDLGTPPSVVAATMKGGRAKLVLNVEGARMAPVVAFDQALHRAQPARG